MIAVGAWVASWAASVSASTLWPESIARSAWVWMPLYKNDLAIVPIIAALFPGWMAIALAGMVVALSGSRNAMLGMFTVAMIRARGWWRLGMLSAALAGLAAVFALDPYNVGRGTARLGQWLVALRMWWEAPWLGQGPFTFIEFYMRWLPDTLPFGIVPQFSIVPWAHNLYLELLAERGLVGFAIFASIGTWAMIRATKPVKTALVAFLVMGIFDLTFLKPWVSITFWSLVGAASMKPSELGG